MNAETLLVVFVGLMVLAFVYAARVRQRPPTLSETTRRLVVSFRTATALIGSNLIPAMQSAVRAAVAFEEEFNRAQAVMQDTSSLVVGVVSDNE